MIPKPDEIPSKINLRGCWDGTIGNAWLGYRDHLWLALNKIILIKQQAGLPVNTNSFYTSTKNQEQRRKGLQPKTAKFLTKIFHMYLFCKFHMYGTILSIQKLVCTIPMWNLHTLDHVHAWSLKLLESCIGIESHTNQCINA